MIIADTGFFLALASEDDAHHAAARDAAELLTTPLITTWPVVTETSHLLLHRVGHRALLAFIESAKAGAFQIFELRGEHWPRIVKLMRQYADLPMDLADASLVVLAEGEEASEADLIAWCKDKAAGYKAPTSVEFRDELARTATGKLQKFKLRAPYWEGYERQVN